MSGPNAEIVRLAVAAYNRRDDDAFLKTWAADGVVDWSRSLGLDGRIFRGHDEIRAFIERFRDTFGQVRIELVGEPDELDDGAVLAENISYVRGRDGIEATARATWLITFRDGKQTSLTLYQTKDDALADAESRSRPR